MRANLRRLFLEDWKNLLVLNLFTVVCSIPIVTIGPAFLALNGVLTRTLDDRCDISKWKEFKAVFKAKFWRGVALEVLVAIYLFLVVWCIGMIDILTGTPQMVVGILLFVSVAMVMMVQTYLVPLLADSRIPFTKAFWLSVTVAFARLPKTLLAAVVTAAAHVFLFTLYPSGIIFYVAIAFAAISAFSVSISWPVLEECIFDE